MNGVALVLGAIRLALSAIVRNKLRAALTVLGILIGVTAVVIVTALAGGASESVGSQIDSFGSNLLFINPENVQSSGARGKVTGRLTENDAKAIARDAVSVERVAPFLSTAAQVVVRRQERRHDGRGHDHVLLPDPPLQRRQGRALDRERRDA